MNRARWFGIAVAACAALAAAVPAVRALPGVRPPADEERFPHAAHATMFPSCNGCHGGVLAADTAGVPLTGGAGSSLYPEPAQCAGCHDGVARPRVTWDGPRREPSNVRFSHAVHNREADLGDADFNCGRCHQQRGSAAFMAVTAATAETCITCHAHEAPSHHSAASRCQTCHAPVARAAGLTPGQVADIRPPRDHGEPGFMANHAPTVEVARTRCATCHARESCARCHANAASVPQIAALESDPRVAAAVADLPATYAVPASHGRPDFTYAHGAAAMSAGATCANCHTQRSCRTCHTGPLAADVIAKLPRGDDGTRGVRLRGQEPSWPPPPPSAGSRHTTTSDGDVLLQASAPGRDTSARARADTVRRVRVHPPGFVKSHGPAASAERTSCAGCHETKRFCTDCHDGESQRRYHPPNFVVRHPADAYARERDCSSCHSREAFCTACHQRTGLASQGRRDVAFHTAQPLWLIQHGRAARQGLESCTTCHVQRDCTQCHAQAGWKVNPHGPGFNPGRMASRNAQVCRTCHLGDPLSGVP